MRDLLVRAEARAEMFEAADWYDRQAPGLGTQFAHAVDVALTHLRSHPEAFPRIDGERRRILLRRFPYQLLYRLEESRIVVLACFHHRRDPAPYRSRR